MDPDDKPVGLGTILHVMEQPKTSAQPAPEDGQNSPSSAPQLQNPADENQPQAEGQPPAEPQP